MGRTIETSAEPHQKDDKEVQFLIWLGTLRHSVIQMLQLIDGRAHGERSSNFNNVHKNVCTRCHLLNKSSFQFGCFYLCRRYSKAW